jgi:hypothetical protein
MFRRVPLRPAGRFSTRIAGIIASGRPGNVAWPTGFVERDEREKAFDDLVQRQRSNDGEQTRKQAIEPWFWTIRSSLTEH